MKSLLMVLVTVISIVTGFVLTDTLYDGDRRLVMDNGIYFVMQTAPAKKVTASSTWGDPSHRVY